MPPRSPRRRAARRPRAARVPRAATGRRRRCSSARRVPGFAGLFDARGSSSRSRGATTSNRGSSCATARAGRSRTARSAAPISRRCPRATGRCSCRASTCIATAADALLRRFAFLPYARLDDLMVSYAAPGGGVGPHFDSYDVFLLQGFGRRRWRYGRQDDLALQPGLPLKILRRFAPAHDEVLAPGDMLYLPPPYAHDGVADRRLHDLLDRLSRAGATRARARRSSISCATSSTCRAATPIPTSRRRASRRASARAMQRRCAAMLRGDPLGPRDGRPLPRLLAVGAEAARLLRPARARRCRAPRSAPRARTRGVRLDRRTQLLYDDRHALHQRRRRMPWPARRRARRCGGSPTRARCRARAIAALPRRSARLMLYDWYRHGYLHADAA